MTRILISNRVQRDFAMVPNSIWRSSLPFAAKGAACYLFSLRDGSMPYVAEMEQAMGLGRDARRSAFRALEAAGFIQWVVERNARGAIVAKTLVLQADVFDNVQPALHRAPENQAHGKSAGSEVQNHHAPEKPSDGFSVPAKVDIRPCSDVISGDTLIKEDIKKARKVSSAASARRSRSVPTSVSSSDVANVRAMVAASFGLPVFDKTSGAWRAASAAIAENNGGMSDASRF